MNGLKFKLDDWGVLKKIFDNVNEIIDEIIIECTDNGLKFKGIDRSHICFFEGIISKELFDEYVLEDILYLYIDLNELVKVLKRGNGKDELIFEANDEIIKLTFKNKNRRSFSITQVDIQDEIKDIPKLDYLIDFVYDFDVIKNSLKDADLYSDRLTFTCQDNLLILTCDGTNGEYVNECELECEYDGVCSSTFGISWLFKIFNNKLSSNDLNFYMGDDYPMLIEMVTEHIKLTYLLAPRIEN